MTDEREIKFVAYSQKDGAGGTVFFGNDALGRATRLADGLYIPSGHRNPCTLYRCALALAAKDAARLEKLYHAAERLVSAIAALRDPAKESTP